MIEVAVPSDSGTALRLSRVLALARWRSPSTVGLLLTIPLIVMSRRFLELFNATSSPDWKFTDLLLSYLVVLVLAVVIGLLLTGIQMLKRNPAVVAYTAPGTAISARFHQDSLELVRTTGVETVPYHRIKDLFTIGGGAFLREKGTRGTALPGDLFTPAARDLIDGARGRAPAAGQPIAGNGERKLIVVAIVGALALVGAGAYAVSHTDTDTDSGAAAAESTVHVTPSAPLPSPCVLTPEQMQRFGFTTQFYDSDQMDAPTLRRCEWDDGGKHPIGYVGQVPSGKLFLSVMRPNDFGVSPQPVRLLGGRIDGQEYKTFLDPGSNNNASCWVVWPTSYGFAKSELRAYSIQGVDVGQLCRGAEELANLLANSLPG
ncbi:hypothetical protein ACFYTS_23735 [Nocardia sp. NPDC004151]|uniref:hypothetical protein n=1 Tax=unclassified Nocardia TaxID=2637762 RepID=UPI003662884B